MRIAATSLAALLSVVASTNVLAPPRSTPLGYTIKAIRVYLFYETLGRADARDLADGKFLLANAMMGGGDAEAPSSTCVVYVDLEGPSFSFATHGELVFHAKVNRRTAVKQVVKLAHFRSEGHTLVIPFVVVGTGCGDLTVEAVLNVAGTRSELSKSIKFMCGE